ncbi:hypothetical protein Tco_0671679 [Tanacetum coccineum]
MRGGRVSLGGGGGDGDEGDGYGECDGGGEGERVLLRGGVIISAGIAALIEGDMVGPEPIVTHPHPSDPPRKDPPLRDPPMGRTQPPEGPP